MKRQIRLLFLLLTLVGFSSEPIFSQCAPVPDVWIDPPAVLTCAAPSTVLQANSNTPGVSFAWSGGGLIFQTQNPTVSQPGVYTVTVTEPTNGCTATASVTVLGNLTPPTITIIGGPQKILTCNNPTLTLEATVLPAGSTISWIGPGGFFSNSFNPTVNQAGLYIATVVAPNGCQTNFTVSVVQNQTPPNINVAAENLTCNDPIATVSAGVSPNFACAWAGPSGFTSTQNSFTTTMPGIYTVVVTNPSNGCTATGTATVQSLPNDLSLTVVGPGCAGTVQGSIAVLNPSGLDILWSNLDTGGSITNLAPGTYCVTVTNPSAGCTVDTCIVLNAPIPPVVVVTAQPANCNGTGGSAIASVSGGMPPYTFQWSNGNTTAAQNNLAAGVYTITITDSKGCTATADIVIVEPTPIIVASVQTTPLPFDCLTEVNFQVAGGVPLYQYLWSNGLTTAPPVQLSAGNYFVVITGANGCTSSLTLQVAPADCQHIIEGFLKKDANDNCLPDAAETNVANWIIKATGGGQIFYSLTDSAGHYFMGVPLGNYLVEALPPNALWQFCSPVAVVVPVAPDTVQADLAAFALNDCPVMTVELSSSLLRRCFDNNYYHLTACNTGSVPATDAYVELLLDPFLEYKNATPQPSAVVGQLLRFVLGTVQPGQCKQISVRVKVSCDAVLGQSHCSEAHVFPDTLCYQNLNWQGGNLTARSTCGNDSLRFVLKNTGKADMTTALDYIVIEDGVMLRGATAPPLVEGDSMVVSVPKNGKTWRVEADQEINHPYQKQVVLSVEGCSANSSFSTGFVTTFPLGDPQPYFDLDCRVNQGSYDPNDKQGFPTGYGAKKYILPETELDYLIRFQNTGTDTAFNVVVLDTLSQWLDIESIQRGTSSHPNRMELAGSNVVRFIFENIMLPDSNVNEPLSHGFVKFKIKPRRDTPLETDIHNSAAIYFDFNDAIITNRTTHRVGENFVAVKTWSPVRPDIGLKIVPHPLADEAFLSLQNLPDGMEIFAQIFDLRGNLLRSTFGQVPTVRLHRDGLPEGVYFLKINTAAGEEIGWGKLMIR